MIFRILFLIALLGISACDGSETSAPENKVAENTFTDTDEAEIKAKALADEARIKTDAEAKAKSTSNGLIDEAKATASIIREAAEAEAASLKQAAKDEAAAVVKAADTLAEDIRQKATDSSALEKVEAARKAKEIVDLAEEKAKALLVTADVKIKGITDAAEVKALAVVDAAKVAVESTAAAAEVKAKKIIEEAELQAADILAAARYASVAAKENVVVDGNDYSKGVLDIAAVSEAPSVMHHKILLNGKATYFTASAGHIVAYAQKDPANPEKKDPQASIFYQAYTRDDLPREKRPVTFLFNGGPGSASIWLHLGSWAPKRLRVAAPDIPEAFQKAPPNRLELIDNNVTLLDQTDLVFVDALTTGYSVAINPHKNSEFLNVDRDAALVRDFITSYTNKYNRQSSPKYLYGESYSGIRAPIVAKLLQDAGSSNFVPDPSGQPAISLSGVVLNSPILDYGSNVDSNGPTSTNAGALPTYAMIADYHKKLRGTVSAEEYANTIRGFATRDFKPLLSKYGTGKTPGSKWKVLSPTLAEEAVLGKLATYTGLTASQWKADLNMWPRPFLKNLMPNYSLGYYDGRLKIKDGAYSPDNFEKNAFANEIKELLPDVLNYSNKSTYVLRGEYWDAEQDKHSSSLPDIAQTLTNDPKLKMLILHGYYDLATPFYQTELDLTGAGLNIPLHMFEGGHMIYYSEATHAPLKKLLNDYYSPPIVSAMN